MASGSPGRPIPRTKPLSYEPARLSQKMFVNTFGGVRPACTGTQLGNVPREAGTLIRNVELAGKVGKVGNDCVTSIVFVLALIVCTFRVWLWFDPFVRVTVRPFTPT